MPESLALTRLLNTLFGSAVSAIENAAGVHTTAQTAFSDTFTLELVVVLGLIAFFALVRSQLSVESPGALQHVAELIHEFTGEQSDQIIGHGYERFQAFVTCIFLFVLANNLLGLVPGLESPTAKPFVPLGLAVMSFLYYNFHGLRVNGPVGYVKQFCGPVWWMAWLLFPVEIVSHLARVMSLTIRLYANMLAGDLLTLICFSMIPVLAPTAFLGLHVMVSVIQAFVFMLLSMIYVSMAVAHEH
jgi:F-type H+-transporting ATPase subunit a